MSRLLVRPNCTTLRASAAQEGKSKAADADEDDLDDDPDDDSEDQTKPLRTTFELNDTLYAEAEIEDTDTVYLWLGVRFVSPQYDHHLPMFSLVSSSRRTLCSHTSYPRPSHCSARNSRPQRRP